MFVLFKILHTGPPRLLAKLPLQQQELSSFNVTSNNQNHATLKQLPSQQQLKDIEQSTQSVPFLIANMVLVRIINQLDFMLLQQVFDSVVQAVLKLQTIQDIILSVPINDFQCDDFTIINQQLNIPTSFLNQILLFCQLNNQYKGKPKIIRPLSGKSLSAGNSSRLSPEILQLVEFQQPLQLVAGDLSTWHFSAQKIEVSVNLQSISVTFGSKVNTYHVFLQQTSNVYQLVSFEQEYVSRKGKLLSALTDDPEQQNLVVQSIIIYCLNVFSQDIVVQSAGFLFEFSWRGFLQTYNFTNFMNENPRVYSEMPNFIKLKFINSLLPKIHTLALNYEGVQLFYGEELCFESEQVPLNPSVVVRELCGLLTPQQGKATIALPSLVKEFTENLQTYCNEGIEDDFAIGVLDNSDLKQTLLETLDAGGQFVEFRWSFAKYQEHYLKSLEDFFSRFRVLIQNQPRGELVVCGEMVGSPTITSMIKGAVQN